MPDSRPGPLVFVALLVLAGALAGSPLAAPVEAAEAETVERDLYVMGTRAKIRVQAATRSAALEASERVARALEETESRLSTWRHDSELFQLSTRLQVGGWVTVGPELAHDLGGALDCAAATEGAFDPTVGPLVEAWGLRSGGRIPTASDLQKALVSTGWKALDRGDDRYALRGSGLRFDAGGFGKGAGLDQAFGALEDLSVDRVVVDLGGQVAWRGGSLDVQIAHPGERMQSLGSVRLPAGSVATSGNSERRVEVEGEAVGHLLDPRTGRPAPDFGSVTVWSTSALDADCLATGFFVLGPEEALRRAEGMPEVEVLVVESTGEDSPAVRWSSGLDGRVDLGSSDDFLPRSLLNAAERFR